MLVLARPGGQLDDRGRLLEYPPAPVQHEMVVRSNLPEDDRERGAYHRTREHPVLEPSKSTFDLRSAEPQAVREIRLERPEQSPAGFRKSGFSRCPVVRKQCRRRITDLPISHSITFNKSCELSGPYASPPPVFTCRGIGIIFKSHNSDRGLGYT